MDLQLGLAVSAPLKVILDLNLGEFDHRHQLTATNNHKRMFEEAFGENFHPHAPRTLSLFTKDKDDEDEDDDDDDRQPHIHNHQNNTWTEGDENSIIGWPPIKSWRKKQWHGHGIKIRTVEMNRDRRGARGSSSGYVKVQMEGVGIARKVDLSRHRSYQTLTNTLIPMFGKCVESVKQYRLAYQDKEGDWFLGGDLPWGTFKQSVQRLKLLRNDG